MYIYIYIYILQIHIHILPVCSSLEPPKAPMTLCGPPASNVFQRRHANRQTEVWNNNVNNYINNNNSA